MSNIRTQLNKVVGKSLNAYYQKTKPTIDELKFKEEYQGRIIDCMVGEVDDNYIETPETDAPIVKLEHSKEGIIKVPSIKGKTILVDSDGNETDTPAEGCKLLSVGEDEDNKLIILSKNSDSSLHHKTEILLDEPLRSLPNGVCDEIVDNKLIRRIGKVVLDCSENYSNGNHLENTLMFRMRVNNFKSENIICNTLKTSKFGAWSIDEELVYYYDVDKYLDIRVNRNRLVTQDLLGLKQWLSENPTEVLYELAEPVIIEMPNTLTLQGFDDTTMYIENTITPTVQYGYNALIPYKEELSKQKEEVETNTLDIENNIIPYLMDMEFNLMNMEDN